MASFGINYNPSQVMMRGPSTSPYLWGGNPPKGREGSSYNAAPASATVPTSTYGAQSVRATGSGPFDPAYRQNLATYAGGLSVRPGGSFNFNPTDFGSFPGQPTGGGNAPVPGMPTSLFDLALSGQNRPAPQPQTATAPPNTGNLTQWMNQFLMNGRSGRMGAWLQ